MTFRLGGQAHREISDEKSQCHLVETPLRDAVAFLEDFHGIPVWLNEKGLEQAGIADDTPVMIDIDGI